MQHFYATHPEYNQLNQEIETALKIRNQQINSGQLRTQRTNSVVTLPVVVHIIHNGGAENISDAQVFQGIQHLNEAYANTGYYDPTDGVNTQIQFCMAQRDPSNNATNGITRDVSAYTTMGGASYYSDDQNVKNINRWNPLCYINIWLVKSIPTSVVGYAYLPSAHGTNVDGIIIEAAYFGSSYSNDVVVAHEMGHYLGLYHTFEGNCTNNDCTTDGDKVCDTPPDQSTAGISCTSSANSCTTDVLSGFATDQNDLTQDYMDYGNFNCMKVFTQGQADRMNWFIQNVRQSLLACKSCMNPCPAPVTADFTTPASPYDAGSSYLFTNTSVSAGSYEWYVNGILKSTSANFNFIFPSVGIFIIKLIAHSANALCDDAVKTVTVNAVCGVTANFTKSATIVVAGTNINFSNSSTGADGYEWQVNGITQSTTNNFSYTSTTAGKYAIKLIAKNSVAGCQKEYIDTVEYTCAVVADFTPSNPVSLINVALTFNSTGTGATTYQWYVNGIASGSGPSFTYTFTSVGAYAIQLIAGNGVCSGSKIVIAYINDKCGNALYQFEKTFGVGYTSSAKDIQPTADGGNISVVNVVSSTTGNGDAALLKTDAGGNVQWMNKYSDAARSFFYKVKPTADGGYIAVGTIPLTGGTTSGIFIVKTNAAGAIMWSGHYAIPNTSDCTSTDIIASADGNYYFTGYAYFTSAVTGGSDVIAGKLNTAGVLQWIKNYDARADETANGIAEDNAQLVICGNKNGINSTAGFLLKINKTDGSTVWAKTYQSANENFLNVITTASGYYVNAMRRPNAAPVNTDHVFITTDFNGNLGYSRYIQPFGTTKEIGWAPSLINSDGNILTVTSGVFGGTYFDFVVQEISFSSGILWSKKYNKPLSWMTTITNMTGKGMALAGFSLEPVSPSLQTDIMKFDSAGSPGSCPSENIGMGLLPAQYITGAADFTAKQLQPQVTTNDAITVLDVVTNTLCQYIKCDSIPLPVDSCKLCDTLAIAGIDTICSFKNAISYSAKRSPGCTIIPSWRLADSSFGTITTVNDSTVNVLYNKTGHTILYSKIAIGCKTIEDSLPVNIFSSPDTVILGPDIQLCKFSSLQLSAGPGFISYLWNDGSVDSILTAYNPGQYFVHASDYCGNIYSDTINLSQAPDVPFDLGPDLNICDNDTLSITAPGSFSSYTWAANYNINSVTGSTIKVWPATDTTYTVVAQVATGCTVLDTIRVTVNRATPLQLGNDSSFCAGDSLIIHAPAGFKNYLWQDGSTGADYIAKQKGIYWLHAEANNGCISKDSVTVTNVYPVPTDFLANTANKCNSKTIDIKAIGTWPAYLWFDNSTGTSVTISNAGQYWLQVKSVDGCSARDTIVITDNVCGTGIHFPNVFTPDHNGYNDTYKPIVNDLPVKYRLRIYNRFGEMVFETTDYKQGWDGMYKGRLQPPDTFVWYCNYQFTGSFEKMEKGALILVR